MGEAINLVENFKVEKVIFNCGEFNDLEKELKRQLIQKLLIITMKMENLCYKSQEQIS